MSLKPLFLNFLAGPQNAAAGTVEWDIECRKGWEDVGNGTTVDYRNGTTVLYRKCKGCEKKHVCDGKIGSKCHTCPNNYKPDWDRGDCEPKPTTAPVVAPVAGPSPVIVPTPAPVVVPVATPAPVVVPVAIVAPTKKKPTPKPSKPIRKTRPPTEKPLECPSGSYLKFSFEIGWFCAKGKWRKEMGTADGLGNELIPEVPKEMTQLIPEVPKEMTQLKQTA